jgi:hypothetical protein
MHLSHSEDPHIQTPLFQTIIHVNKVLHQQ